MPEGIAVRHSRRCSARRGDGCDCSPSFQAMAWSARDDKPVRRTFPSLKEARAWRADAQVKLRQGSLQAPTAMTLSEVAGEWFAAARTGRVRTRSGQQYKPSALRSYEDAWRTRLEPRLG